MFSRILIALFMLPFLMEFSAWLDHSFSDKPLKIFIEARPGGGFYEIFDRKAIVP